MMVGTFAAAAFTWDVLIAGDIDSTSPRSKSSTARERTYLPDDHRLKVRSFQGISADAPIFGKSAFVERTAQNEGAIANYELRKEEALVTELIGFSDLQEGWDGESAAVPNPLSIENAVNFVRAMGPLALRFEPSLNVDGTAMLETEDGWAIQFLASDKVCAVLPDFTGFLPFDGITIPHQVLESVAG